MKRLWLVGESLPKKEDGSERKAHKTTNLPATLVPLDPRHGVFPNLVMKPLFTAGYSLSQSHIDKLLPFFQDMNNIVSDKSERRFNLFENRATNSKGRAKKNPETKTETEIFEINNEGMSKRIESFDLDNDLWLVFGHQTNFGLLLWLLNSDKKTEEKFSRNKKYIKAFSEMFITAVNSCCEKSTDEKESTKAKKSLLSSRIGMLHRLCTGVDKEQVLVSVIKKLDPTSSREHAETISKLLRATVPLLHNEGYQDGTNPTGNAQSHFVQHAKGMTAQGDLYWQVMGNTIATRVLGDFVE